MKRGGLGRGLSALLPGAVEEGFGLLEIPVEAVAPNPRQPRTTFEDGLAATIDWYRANEAWWRAARSGDWDGWYARQYGQRLATGEAAAANEPATANAPTVD